MPRVEPCTVNSTMIGSSATVESRDPRSRSATTDRESPTAAARDRAFYEGKVAGARWFAASVLPLLSAQRSIAEATDLGLMELDEAAF